MSKEKCPFCSGGELSRRIEPETYSYKDVSITVDQPGLYCNNCDEAVFNGADLKVTRCAIHDLHAQGDGFLTSAEVKQTREKLGFTQKEAGVFFGGGVNAFSRYERGEARQIRATDTLLKLLDANPKLLSTMHFNDHMTVVKDMGTWVPKKSSHLRVLGSLTPTITHVRESNGLEYGGYEKLVTPEYEPQPLMVANG